ncbi:preprotein translocase subunit SecA [Limisalsivibrio acetivorans]|uniref:preprotein translocase subunit SecA n=1 Tax=Limisalsivibrio acetivorans TaxID=1304888 RepID=UPI0003B748A8|nr:preprotein translocase subunit SecA [Limisalsivibrio acetivorans]
MIKVLAKKLLGDFNQRYLKKISGTVEKVNSLEPEFEKKSIQELQELTAELKQKVADGASLDDLMPEAFAAVREASKKTLGMRHYDVQLLGGYVLHKGKIAEMKTGEGKTLVATLALYLQALADKGTHLVTVNDYLARRDAQWMGTIYLALGLTVGIIQHEVSYLVVWDNEEEFTTKLVPATRKEAYAADITYGTNNEFGFDYLRDNMKLSVKDMVQRPLNFAIVDEVDSILIDEARTPLIISGPTEDSTEVYYSVDEVIRELKTGEDFTVDEKRREVQLTDSGINKVEKLMAIDNLFDLGHVDDLHYVNNSLKAHHVFKRDQDYVVQDGKVTIVDEFTGRMMPGRRYSDGLHQALEAKEKVVIEKENQTLASITFQNYFRMYNTLSGMTGTASTEAEEFSQIYGLGVVSIPTHMPMVRDDRADVIYKTMQEKYEALVNDIAEFNEQGRPVLVGTASIEKSEIVSALLKRKKIKHEILNAKNHEREAQIIALAGQQKAVTIATNMAGRGTDIKLGEGVKDLGGLHIIGTERNESRRVDNQLRGRSGRQGDPGSSRFYLSLEDDLMRIFGSEKISTIMNKLGMQEGEPIEHGIITRAIENAQKKVEAMNFEIRKYLLDYDNVMNQQRKIVYTLRNNILDHEEVENVALETLDNVLDSLYEAHIGLPEQIDAESLESDLKEIFGIEPDLKDLDTKNADEKFKGVKQQLIEALEAKKQEFGQHYKGIFSYLLINVLDDKWKEHLLSMDHLRDSVRLRGYGQKDPLNEYKKEAYDLFTDMVQRTYTDTCRFLFRIRLVQEDVDLEQKRREEEAKRRTIEERRNIFGNDQQQSGKPEPVRRDQPKVGRNDPCPCGSGKKYKKCCGAKEPGEEPNDDGAVV